MTLKVVSVISGERIRISGKECLYLKILKVRVQAWLSVKMLDSFGGQQSPFYAKNEKVVSGQFYNYWGKLINRIYGFS